MIKANTHRGNRSMLNDNFNFVDESQTLLQNKPNLRQVNQPQV